jgi:hypothetical protein
MDAPLAPRGLWRATTLFVVLTLALAPRAARAELLVRSLTDAPPPAHQGVARGADGSRFAPPLTVQRPFGDSDDSRAEIARSLDPKVAAAVQALMVLAIPPTLVMENVANNGSQTGPKGGNVGTASDKLPVIPPPPPIQTESTPPENAGGSGGTVSGPTAQHMPEPASLLSALVGSGIAVLAALRRRRKPVTTP